jgi:hypothetical protein
VPRAEKGLGAFSLQIIDPKALQKHFPRKWDVADELPSDVNESLLKDLLLSSLQKGVDPQ